MKNIKKILFTFTIIFTGFCCKMNVLGDTTCQYKTMYPFTADKILTDSNIIDSQYIKYVYIELLGHSLSEYEEMQNARKDFYGEIAYFNATMKKNFDNRQTVEEILEVGGEDVNGKPFSTLSNGWYGYSSKDSFTNTCPDIVVYSNDTTFPQIFKNYYSVGNISSSFYSALTDSYFVDTDRDALYRTYGFLLISQNAATRLQMATIYPYIGYFGLDFEYDIQKDVHSIIKKYLALDGWKDLLDDVNLSLDTKKNPNDKIERIKNILIQQIENESLNIDIDSDLKILKRFDEPLGGVFNALESYLSKYDMTVSEWYDNYMPNNQTKYIRALLMILSLFDDPSVKEKMTQLNDLKKASTNYGYCRLNFMGDEEKIKEECKDSCVNFMTLNCATTSDPSGCMMNASLTCSKADSDSIQSQMNDKIDDTKQKLNEEITVKLIKYFENKGIEIGDDKDFCDILVGKDNEKGLYPYIKMVLNVIRIGGPVLVVILTAFDVMKVISSFKDDENRKFWNHLKIRLICLVVLILVPTIINFLVKLVIESSCSVEI